MPTTATQRQLNNAANLACKTVEFEGETLPALQALMLDDELIAVSRRTMRQSDYARRAALRAAIVNAHNAACRAQAYAASHVERAETAAKVAA